MRRKDPNEVRHALARSSWWFCLLGLGAWSLCDSSPCRGSEISLQMRIRGLDEADLVVRWHAEF
ncbi:MAG: hypothetical protein H6682_22955 [Candidatus Eisenbacteria bacterium]|nr:hypothetical protein [Candidatus Eisenbacteria bacterium]